MIAVGDAQYIGDRENQEDYCASVKIDNNMLCLVADGMGAYKGGEVASLIVVNSFILFFKKYLNTKPLNELFLDATHFSNNELLKEKKKNLHLDKMGTTLIAVYMTEKELHWVSVGDSILFSYSIKKLKRLNTSHSIGYRLTSSLTGYKIPNIEIKSLEIQKNDRFMIASDGIETIDDNKIEELFSKINPSQKLCDEIIFTIKNYAKKEQDNITIMILENKDKQNLDFLWK